uniref:DNA-directed RNA polymerase RPB10 homolog n=1 Tax=Marseillevirus LCMAC102 TaxID=2506603 RepID=A0A481YVT6_9VIRU|nr:MAG: RNA polymerases N/ 8 kDa subunit [Marseillevirus LCMAC102]
MSFFPVRCFTCGKIVKWSPFEKLVESGVSEDETLDKLGYRRMCCRRMFLGHVPELEKAILLYNTTKKSGDPE